MKFLPIAVVFSLGTLGCKAVIPSDLTGTWVVTTESRQHFLSAAQRQASAQIVLDANGGFVASEVPEDLLYGQQPGQGTGLVTGSGTWKLVSRDGKQQVELEFRAIAVGQRGGLPYGTQLNVSSGLSPGRLYYFRGDPDQARRIEFERL